LNTTERTEERGLGTGLWGRLAWGGNWCLLWLLLSCSGILGLLLWAPALFLFLLNLRSFLGSVALLEGWDMLA